MHARRFLILTLCLILASVRIAGTHVHLAHTHDDDETTGFGATIHHMLETADEDSPSHLKSHLIHGDIDTGDTVQVIAKSFLSSVVFAPALILLAILGLFAPRVVLRLRVHWTELRPPDRRRAFDLTPPSHAPPVTP